MGRVGCAEPLCGHAKSCLLSFCMGVYTKEQRTGIRKSLRKLYINTAPINWNCKLAIPLKHIIFTEPFIADGECLCAFWAGKSRKDFIQNRQGFSAGANLEN